jgi:hypothetical protein
MKAVFMLMGVVVVVFCLCAVGWTGETRSGSTSPYAAWKNGPSSDPSFFPLAVWVQEPKLAQDYKAIGINTYVGADGTREELDLLREAGIRAICHQSSRTLQFRDDPTIAGWMHGDEPDNAQEAPGGGYGPGIPPQKIIDDYHRVQANDPTRPVLLNLGQQVANDEWIGRGCEVTAYPEYVKGGDIVSFDVYPVVGLDKPNGEDYLWYDAKGVDRLRRWGGGNKIVWNCIETTRISDLDHKPTPHQVRAEVWMSLIHGSMGIIYFCHQFKPQEDDAALLTDKEMSGGVRAINEQILSLAPALNSPTIQDGAVVTTMNPVVPIDLMVKEYGGATYVCAVGMRNAETTGRFRITGVRSGTVEVVGEGRTLTLEGREFRDAFKPYDVHIYKITGTG